MRTVPLNPTDSRDQILNYNKRLQNFFSNELLSQKMSRERESINHLLTGVNTADRITSLIDYIVNKMSEVCPAGSVEAAETEGVVVVTEYSEYLS